MDINLDALKKKESLPQRKEHGSNLLQEQPQGVPFSEIYMTEIKRFPNGKKYIRSWFSGYKMQPKTQKKKASERMKVDRTQEEVSLI